MTSQSDRIVLITGAASGIGLATAKAFARAGDTVVLTDRDGTAARAAASSLGSRHWSIALDVSVESAACDGVAAVLERFGRIDVLVNNAGIVDPQGTLAIDKTLAEIEHIVGVNLEGCYVMAREVGRAMVERGQGVIVNIASMAGVIAIPGRAAYSISKGAVLGFTRALACELAPQGVRVNAVLPGYVATEIVRSLVAHGKVDPKQVASRVPLGRMAEPEEIAEPIVWAASNTYLAGAFIVADGGYHAFGGSGPASTGETFTAQTSDRPVVVVAGGASGIGAAVADHYVKKGDRVIVLDRVRSELSSSADDRVEMALDVTDYNAVAHTFKLIAERFGTIDTLVNNTVVEDQLIASTDQSLERFRHDISVNLVGPFAVAQAAARIMMASGGGAVINLMSIAAFDEAPGPLSHCAVESGIGMMTRSLACEWAVAGIRVNAVASGHIETPGVKAPEASGNSDIDAVHQRIPMARRGRAEEIADAVDFLASPRSSYVTGSIYVVDGGWTACQARY